MISYLLLVLVKNLALILSITIRRIIVPKETAKITPNVPPRKRKVTANHPPSFPPYSLIDKIDMLNKRTKPKININKFAFNHFL